MDGAGGDRAGQGLSISRADDDILLPADYSMGDIDLVPEVLEKIETEEPVLEILDDGARQDADFQERIAPLPDDDRLDLCDTELDHAAVGKPHCHGTRLPCEAETGGQLLGDARQRGTGVEKELGLYSFVPMYQGDRDENPIIDQLKSGRLRRGKRGIPANDQLASVVGRDLFEGINEMDDAVGVGVLVDIGRGGRRCVLGQGNGQHIVGLERPPGSPVPWKARTKPEGERHEQGTRRSSRDKAGFPLMVLVP